MNLTNYNPDLVCRIASEKAGCSLALAQTVSKGLSQPIRAVPEPNARESVYKAVKVVCDMFALEQPSGHVLSLTFDTIRKSFGGIGANELLTAAQMYASNELTIEGKFFGKFNLQVFGQILDGYLDHRKAVALEIMKQKQLIQDTDRLNAMAQAKRDAYDSEFPNLLFGYQGTFDDLPAEWYDTIERLGIRQFTQGEKADAWELAESMAKAELESRAKDTDSVFEMRSIIKQLQGNDFAGLRIKIAKKLLIWEQVLNNSLL
jgi:hypothetical protein